MSTFYTVQPITDFSIFSTPPSQRKGVQFKATWSTTVEELEYELVHLGGRDVVMEIAVQPKDLRLDGSLRANARPTHPGVRISFQTRKHGALSYTCDTYEARWAGQIPDWQANVRAIVKTLEALRAVDRHGATKGEQYAGFKELQSGTGATALGGMTREQAIEILCMAAHGAWAPGVRADHSTWRLARAKSHPDRHDGGRTMWDQVEQAATVLGLSS